METPLEQVELKIVDGPDKPDLQLAVAYPERDLRVHFRTKSDAVDARLDHMEELADGTQFGLEGVLTSGLYKGWQFRAVYDVGSRSGVMRARTPV